MKRSSRYSRLLLPAATLLLAVALLPACQKDPEPAPEPEEIAVTVSSQAMESTRALTLIEDATTLRDYDIRIDAYFHGTTTAYFSGSRIKYKPGALVSSWNFVNLSDDYDNPHYWPIEGSVYTATSITVGSLDFVGYVPYASTAAISNTGVTIGTYAAGAPTFSAALPITSGSPNTFGETNQASLQEFMYAYTGDQKKGYDGETPKTGADIGKVAMNLQHPFALVSFYLKQSPRNTTFTSLTLKDINTSGSYVHGTGWASLGTPADLSITVNKTIPDELNFNGLIGGPYVVIPQTPATANNLVVNRTPSGESAGDITATINTTWMPGKKYSYYLDLGKDDGHILVDVVIETWQGPSYDNEIEVK